MRMYLWMAALFIAQVHVLSALVFSTKTRGSPRDVPEYGLHSATRAILRHVHAPEAWADIVIANEWRSAGERERVSERERE